MGHGFCPHGKKIGLDERVDHHSTRQIEAVQVAQVLSLAVICLGYEMSSVFKTLIRLLELNFGFISFCVL